MNAKKRTKKRLSKKVPGKRIRRRSSKKMQKKIKKPVRKPSFEKPPTKKVPKGTLSNDIDRWKEFGFLRSKIGWKMPLKSGTILSFKKNKKDFDKTDNDKHIQVEHEDFEGKYVCHDLYTKESELRTYCFVPQEISGEKIKMIIMTQGTINIARAGVRDAERFAGVDSFAENKTLILSQINNLLKGLKKEHGVKEVELVMGGHSLGGADIENLTVEIVNGVAVDFKHKKQLPPDKKVSIDPNNVSNFDMIKKIDTFTFNSAGVEKSKTNELETAIDFLDKQDVEIAKNISCNHVIYGGDPVQQAGYHLNPKPKYAKTRVLKATTRGEGSVNKIANVSLPVGLGAAAIGGPLGYAMLGGIALKFGYAAYRSIAHYHMDADVFKLPNAELSLYANDVEGIENKKHMDAIEKELNNFNKFLQNDWVKKARKFIEQKGKKWSYSVQEKKPDESVEAREYITAKHINTYHNSPGSPTAGKFVDLEQTIAEENTEKVLLKRIAYTKNAIEKCVAEEAEMMGIFLTAEEESRLNNIRTKQKKLATKLSGLQVKLKQHKEKVHERLMNKLTEEIKLKYTNQYISKVSKKFPKLKRSLKNKFKGKIIKRAITALKAKLKDAREKGVDSDKITDLENDLKKWQQKLSNHNKTLKKKHEIVREIRMEINDYLQQQKKAKSKKNEVELILDYMKAIELPPYALERKVLQEELNKYQKTLQAKKSTPATLNKKIRVAKANMIGYFGYLQRRKGSRYQKAFNIITELIKQGHTIKYDPQSNKIKLHVNRKKLIDKKQKIEGEMSINDLNTFINGRWLTKGRKQDFLNNLQDFLVCTKEKAKVVRKQQVELEKVSKKPGYKPKRRLNM